MRAAKRFWIYAGLGVPEGVALVRRPALKKDASRRVLLVGDISLQGLVAPLTRLAAEGDGAFHADLREATLRQWAEQSWLSDLLEVFRPTAALVALDPRQALPRQALRGRIERAGVRSVWLVPPGIAWRASRRYVPAPELNAKGYALWAARAMALTR